MKTPWWTSAGRHQAPRGRALPGLALLLALACNKPQEAAVPTAALSPARIAAAADLSVAFEEMGQAYEQLHHEKVTLIFGASGTLAKQLSQGAPYDAFYSANAAFVDETIAAGSCDARTKARYAQSHLVLWTRGKQADTAPKSLAELEDPRFVKISIAHPEHAPYGRAAKEALEKSGLWEKLRPRMVHADNVKHALQFAQTGNADAAIVPLPLVLSLQDGQYTLLDKGLYTPVEQTSVRCKNGGNPEGAQRFAALLQSEQGRALMQRHGFILLDP
ncbi:molybdate ABC transporter substrate-binding protein [Stigmatella hybrida]|uniref:molybdate ABC transporter substrate-binding protein n=1 Tax=Stigmatella hybrida TaxID=394097 RepID=UPI001CDAFF3B|nr:molybdate ABC transporter substrate-binding protein [Stigmatella hybrida]